GDIKQAILTLREGDTWYRIFQGQWRKAVGLHKSLLRNKRKIPSIKRLEQLEQVIKLMNLKEQWRSSPAWAQFLGFSAPSTPSPLEGYILLARWNRGIKIASEEIKSTLIDPISLDPDQTRTLRHEFSAFKLEI